MGKRAKTNDIQEFILDNVEKHPSDIAKITADHFAVTRQAVSKHLQRLVSDGLLSPSGNTRSRSYQLVTLFTWDHRYEIAQTRHEDRPWAQDVRPLLDDLPVNVVNLWHYGFTEMFNNAIDHSEGSHIDVLVKRNAVSTTILVGDDGVGIFKKIQLALDLADERQSTLELAKGKFTTDPINHSGEGVFFTSRMFDAFALLAGGACLMHRYGEVEDWILEPEERQDGTVVQMKLCNGATRDTDTVFNQFTVDDDFGFTKTIVPVRLTQSGDDNLVSRSQGKRLLSRFERFRTVILDFKGVDSIGQAFADEVFRVFPSLHPEVDLVAVNTGPGVVKMISRAKAAG